MDARLLLLPNGELVLMRPLTPADRGELLNAFHRTSRRTRINRFFTDRTGLSDSELRYFTCVDQHDHVAWCAIAGGAERSPGVAVARFIVDRRSPASAEIALTVVDDYQGLGIGTALLGILDQIAHQRGIEWLWGQALADNDRALRFFRRLGASVERDNEICEVRLRAGSLRRVPAFAKLLPPQVHPHD